MTSPQPRKRPPSENAFESISDWFELHNREVTYAVIAIAVIIGGFWFYNRSKSLKAERAQRALYTAEQSLEANKPLAESDLRKLISRYEGTAAADEAVLTLAQLLYDDNRYAAGIDVVKNALPTLEKSKDFASSAHLTMAAGYEQMRKFADAANEYAAAAKAARFDQDRQRYESNQAQALVLAGQVETAKTIWTRLAADSKGTVAGEARVRLGELTAKAEPKS